jgi:hypothetical protein
VVRELGDAPGPAFLSLLRLLFGGHGDRGAGGLECLEVEAGGREAAAGDLVALEGEE